MFIFGAKSELVKNTKERIMEVAKNLFMKKGVAGTSVRDIAKKAGINIAALNYHFRSKESLFEMIFDRTLNDTVPALQDILNSNYPLEEKIKRYIDAYFNMVIKNPQLPFFVLSVLNNDPKKINRLKAFQSLDYTDIFARQLKEEAENGNIRRVDPNHFFINLQALLNFPFAIQEAVKERRIMDEKELVNFFTQRKKIVTESVLASLKPDQGPVPIPKRPGMFIHSIGHYFPDEKVNNEYYSKINGLTEEDMYKKSGIRERRKAASHENTNTMAIEAVQRMMKSMSFPITEIDLIVAATYTPWDTVATPAHDVQRKFNIENAKAFFVSSACSSYVTAVEIVESYFAAGKAHKALVVVSEHNTAFNDDNNLMTGFLWGDGAAAMVITKERQSEEDVEIIDLFTRALAHVSKGPSAVYCRINSEKIQMPDGKDVFVNASQFMTAQTSEILERNNYNLEDLSYLIPHQANMRIINKVGKDLGLKSNKVITNIEYLGNTGCAGCAIGLSEHWNRYRKDELIAVAVFGGGYSSGCMLMRK
jgi:3-oxoacyl-[acyl-carrier-protein] synthase-3